ncbi:MAG TPA: FAD/NAD(P)-binding protein [Rhizomicrobium sp.]|jgi:uncharacterized NAD(P)/FAD-binding protein YdhS|nr:FAD/NAD(P)-binding protein [Rhizomicrobium sp.]
MHSIVIVGGGFSGALFALKLRRAKPDWRIVVVEPKRRIGRGIAYGACAPEHMLNVPVSRMELGLVPGFAEWLAAQGASGDLQNAFMPRARFGDYMQEQLAAARAIRGTAGLHVVRGEAVRLLPAPRRGVLLTDGREIAADMVVLAMGNLPPRPPGGPDRWLYDTGYFVPDPWAQDAFDDVDADAPLLLIGTGLTMVDIALNLCRQGHRGRMLAVSRRGLLPKAHQGGGGSWPAFLDRALPGSPLALSRVFRAELRKAAAQDVPWQRVFDAARPAIASVWDSWSDAERRQFLRHLRPRWDIHRHRMAPAVAAELQSLLDSGQLETAAGRIAGYREAGDDVEVALHMRGGGKRSVVVGHVVNCTGPGGDFDKIAIPLIANLRENGLAAPDPLGLGLATDDCAVLGAGGAPSSWLFAIGPLTKPAWWEIVAVPEIALQIERLVTQIANGAAERLTTQDFLGIGEGI